MATVSTVIDRQNELFGVISRAIENLKKQGAANINRGTVHSRMEALKSNWNKFQANHESLFRSCSAEQKEVPYFKDNLYELCEEEFLNAHGTMLNMLDNFDRTSRLQAAKEAPGNNATSSRTRRLPRIDIPKFSGDYAEWSQFKDLFESIVSQNPDISNVERLHYLKLSLSGEPAQLLKNVSISGDNFDRAWETLVERYDNNRILIEAHLAIIFSTRKLKAESSIELRKLFGDVKEALGALETLKCPVKHWDLIIIFLLTRKLDPDSLKRWEETLGARTQTPSLDEFETFLNGRIHTLEALERSQPKRQQAANQTAPRSTARTYTAATSEQKCSLCSSGHYLSACPTYLNKTPDQRREIIVSKNLCFNCLGPHQLKSCRNSKRCRTCHKQHHTTLHQQINNIDTISTTSTTPTSSTITAPLQTTSTASLNTCSSTGIQASSHLAQSQIVKRSPVLLATAVVTVLSRHGEPSQIRALLDQGSEVSFISESTVQSLKLTRRAASIPILGIGAQRNSVSNGSVSLTIVSRFDSSRSFNIEALVLPKLTAYLPPAQVTSINWPHIQGLQLADPTFATPGKINLILGADIYSHVLEDGLCRGQIGTPIAQKTAFGWILSGELSNASRDNVVALHSVIGLHCSLDSELLDLLQRFWTQEEISPRSQSSLSPEEEQCEDHFKSTHARDSFGRFIVRLPLRNDVSDFGNSRVSALNSLLRLEKRFISNPSLKVAYNNFLQEYLNLDHMRLAKSSKDVQHREFFLPHHGVVRETSSTTKLRVVFNGSQKTNLGVSLNDILHIGPKLQTDLTDVLSRWRRHQYVFSADIEKMYRQIRVHETDWPMQKILWRNSPLNNVEEYHLCTVTYGLACAPYLALRCLRQLAIESTESHALAANILHRDIYVDDVLSGASEISHTKKKINQLNEVLKAGGFKLRKWISNDSKILVDVPLEDQELTSSPSPVDDSTTHHTLGMLWDRYSDSFVFTTISPTDAKMLTKRSVLSFIARMFDPLGWLAPITVFAKIFMQELWAIRLDWDEELPDNLKSRWITFTQQISNVSTISVPRWFGTNADNLAIEIHGFSDASQSAIAAVVYVRVLDELNDARVTLVSAKTKIAPLKRVTIPRLELSAAVLLVRQVLKIREALDFREVPTHLWTDSTVALTWIKSHPSRWKEFVRNRVSFIQELEHSRWHHVSGKENPADLASRGVTPANLPRERLWWTGPEWLRRHSTTWPSSIPPLKSTIDLEERPVTCSTALENQDDKIWDLIDNYSSLTKLLRITAWLFRARDRFRLSALPNDSPASLAPAELNAALLFWVKITQQAYFAKEFHALRENKPVASSSKLLRLSPILDPHNLLRLRGRLQFSQLNPEEKHPLILPRTSHLTTLVIDYHHRRTLHGGTQLTLASIRQQFWIVGGRVPIRSFIHRCVTCCRHRATTAQQLIGQLPTSRVSPCRPFFNTGVDYAGPLALKTFRGRGAKTYKGYFVIFICLSTSAIHLETVTDYSTNGFLAAYKRFTGRRGLCASITSDCGTNLIGADAELKRLFRASSKEWAHISNLLANDGVIWRFNPPSAPHFGGKWEAGVKSVKYHLRRVIGEAILTYEELSTLLVQIEAVLNSRPLSALSDDPNDISALTPGHFLIGSALTTVPEPSLESIPTSRLSRLQLLRQMTESFWMRWSSECLHQLQASSKWNKQSEPLKEGALVIIKDERFPPSKWPLARIIDTHPGSDGLIRVVTLKTATTTLKRPIVKLCPLPNFNED